MRLQAATLAVLIGACSVGSSSASGENATVAEQEQPGPSGRPFQVTPLATFQSPWALAFLPDGSALVTEKPGRVKLWRSGGGTSAVAGVPTVASGGQGGLLDIKLSPTFPDDRLVYLTYAEPSAKGGSGLALARAVLVQDRAGTRLDRSQVIWRDPAGGRGGQFGAIIAFAPDGRSLFLTSGERQRFTPAQDLNQPLGKILHLTLDGKPAAGNPLGNRQGERTVTVTDPPEDTRAARDMPGRRVSLPGPNLTPAATWSSGHRNPYGLAFDAQGRLWETEMGPRGGDELNLIKPGRNYGWPLVSNGRNYNGVPIPAHSTRPDLEAPKLFWDPVISPSSLLIYSGDLFPQWKGSGFIGALSGQALVRVTFDGERAANADRWDMGARIRWVGQGPGGAIYLLEDGESGRLLRLAPTARR
ncbi:PQQ-dependent sugar dehydrogenase [Sphingomonas sp. BN140010]|uniref:PQQ-dependent sugar dehydrogenase n=1 Tax=Sphingomonas arvum TaxID=2992113 RepID=A0ABT3JHJ6_9SPHN|nr:PQQ-dependent sugar dehydrogenase [Sphingomonas sp. BN140010]MCW3798509.1 PQQ-dependent sugar dehydrogenase [Sphingomonas sp. BN140010]